MVTTASKPSIMMNTVLKTSVCCTDINIFTLFSPLQVSLSMNTMLDTVLKSSVMMNTLLNTVLNTVL